MNNFIKLRGVLRSDTDIDQPESQQLLRNSPLEAILPELTNAIKQNETHHKYQNPKDSPKLKVYRYPDGPGITIDRGYNTITITETTITISKIDENSILGYFGCGFGLEGYNPTLRTSAESATLTSFNTQELDWTDPDLLQKLTHHIKTL